MAIVLVRSNRPKKSDCKTPGMKIRSKGKGRGLARGKGGGPVGVPYQSK